MDKPNDLYKSEYQVYLESEEFGKIRQRVFRRDGNCCKICGSIDNLQIHHLTYRHVYQERDYELICLCRKCHEIYHSIDNYKKYADNKNSEEDEANNKESERLMKEREESWKQKRAEEAAEAQERMRQAKEIEEYIKDTYCNEDYAKNGNLDMCSWNILNPIIEKECQLRGADSYDIRKMDLMKWFLCRRYELLLRCIEQGYSLKQVKEGTKFDPNWLFKWYNKNLLLSRLEEEKTINSIKEELNYAET